MDFSIYVYLVRPMVESRQDFEKWFSVSMKGVKNEAFPIKKFGIQNFHFYCFPKSLFLPK